MEKVEFLMEDCLRVANLNAKQKMHLRNLKFNYHGLNDTATYTVKITAACACTTAYLGLVRPYCSNELTSISSNRVSKASRLL